jgi:hypothetical protein
MFGDQTIGLGLSNPTNASLGSPSNAILTIANVFTGPGVLAFSQTNYTVSVGATNAVITVIRTNGSSGTVSVTLTTSNGTAIAGSNYLSVDATLNFASGETNQSVDIPILPQTQAGANTTVYLTLSDPQPPVSQGGPTIGGPTQVILTIQNELENFSFAQASYSVTESNVLNVPVVRGGPATNSASVSYFTYSPTNAAETNGYAVPNVDYVPASGTLIFNSNQPQSIPITILQGNVVNGPLTFQIILTNPAPAIVQIGTPGTNTITILSDLTAFQFSTNSYVVAENGSNLNITVNRLNTSVQPASVQFATSNGTNQNPALNAQNQVDYIATSGTLNFASGQTTNNFSITILNPNILEGNKTFNLALSDPLVNVTNPAYLFPPSNAIVTITNVLTSTTKIVPSPITVSAYASSAYLVWTTPVSATVQVAYGLTSSYGSLTSLSGPSSNHVVLLTGLTRNATYYYRAVSWFDVTPTPPPYATNGSFATVDTLILNTQDAYKTGVWLNGSTAITNYYGNFYDVANTTQNNPTATATYSPSIITPGFYNVYTWYPTNVTFSTNAQMIVDGATNTITDGVNQTTYTASNNASWQPLATNFYFASGTNGNVIIDNGTGETNKLVVANAMMWSYVDSQDYPPATNGSVPAWWSAYYDNTPAADTNYFDYVFGLSPNDPASTLNFSVTEVGGNVFTAAFSPYQGGRVYRLEISTNLSNPQWLTLTNLPSMSLSPITNAGNIFTNGNGDGVFTVTQPIGAQLFYRLAAQLGTNY